MQVETSAECRERRVFCCAMGGTGGIMFSVRSSACACVCVAYLLGVDV